MDLDTDLDLKLDYDDDILRGDGMQSEEGSASRIHTQSNFVSSYENSELDLRLQAQEHMYRQTLIRERNKVSLHSLEEVGRSITAISQRRRQYFLDYKTCNSIRQIRQWFSWETKRNLDTNHVAGSKPDNAATRGLKNFLNKIDFYLTLITRFGEYVIDTLLRHYTIELESDYEVTKTKEKMLELQEKCTILLSDNNEVELESPNYTEVELKFPIISILRQVHDTLCTMTDLSTLWRMHARYAARYEHINYKRSRLASVERMDDKMEEIKSLESRIRLNKYDISEVESDLKDREAMMASTEFCEVYSKCTDRIEELSVIADEMKLEIKSLDTTIKYLHEKAESFKKVQQHKRKQKRDENLRKREEKLKELEAIEGEIRRLEEHKTMLDMKEETWLRGGFEQELGVIQDLKNRQDKLKKIVIDLQQRKEQGHQFYHETREKIMHLDSEYEQLDREYEYVKRLAAAMLPMLWKTGAFQQLPINSVKPNRISHDKEAEEQIYPMTQPKGVAMVISNDEGMLHKPSSRKLAATRERITPLPGSHVTPVAPAGSPTENSLPALINCFTALSAQLGFYIMMRRQLTSSAVNHNLASLSEQYRGFACGLNSIMLFLSARSDEYGRPLGADETKSQASVARYLKHFSHSQCPSLIGKPKIFVLLLRVTVRDPKAPTLKGTQKKKPELFSTATQTDLPTSVFKPETIDISEFGEDILLIRIMHQNAGGVEAAPTFGGTSVSHTDKLPWYLQILIGAMMEQCCYKDLLSILGYVKEEIALGTKARASPTPKTDVDDDVEMFIDHSLKKKLYLMPGI